MAKSSLRANRPSRDEDFATRTFQVISALTRYQFSRLMVSMEQKDLIALLQSAEDLREKLLGAMQPHMRTFLEDEMKRRRSKPDEKRQAQELAVKIASKIPESPPKPGKKFLAMRDRLGCTLAQHDMVELGSEKIPLLFSSMAECARVEGILSLGIFLPSKDRFLAAGLQLVLDGSEPAVIAEVQNPWKQTLVRHYRTRYEMIEMALTEMVAGRSPLLTAHKLGTLYRTEGGPSVDEKDGTVASFKRRVRRTPFAAMDLDQLSEALMVMAWIAHRRRFEGLEKVLDSIDEELTREGLRWLLEGIEGNKLHGPSPAIMLDILATRIEALLRRRELCYSMVVDGLASLQMGMNPRLLEFKLKSYIA